MPIIERIKDLALGYLFVFGVLAAIPLTAKVVGSLCTLSGSCFEVM